MKRKKKIYNQISFVSLKIVIINVKNWEMTKKNTRTHIVVVPHQIKWNEWERENGKWKKLSLKIQAFCVYVWQTYTRIQIYKYYTHFCQHYVFLYFVFFFHFPKRSHEFCVFFLFLWVSYDVFFFFSSFRHLLCFFFLFASFVLIFYFSRCDSDIYTYVWCILA